MSRGVQAIQGGCLPHAACLFPAASSHAGGSPTALQLYNGDVTDHSKPLRALLLNDFW